MSDAELTHVTDTAFWVAYYRAKESLRPKPLFQDPYAKLLIGQRGEKIAAGMAPISRYTEWSVASRTVIIDRMILKLIQEEKIDAVINLGAGLDTRPYRMALPPDLQWIEADYPVIIQHKTGALSAEAPRCRLLRVEVDLADQGQRRSFLKGAAADRRRVLVLTEGVLPYLSPEQVAELAKDLLAESRFVFWIAEYFHPKVYPHLKSTVRSAKMKNAPFRFYPDDWYGFFSSQGWTEKETRFTGEIAAEFKRPFPMPWWAKLIFPLLPAKVKQESLRMTGYVLFTRKAGATDKAKPDRKQS